MVKNRIENVSELNVKPVNVQNRVKLYKVFLRNGPQDLKSERPKNKE